MRPDHTKMLLILSRKEGLCVEGEEKKGRKEEKEQKRCGMRRQGRHV